MITSNENYIRIKLILSLMSGEPLKLKNIRRDDDEPGLRGF
jgi:RNA 3'-terminal phosphate cyclase